MTYETHFKRLARFKGDHNKTTKEKARMVRYFNRMLKRKSVDFHVAEGKLSFFQKLYRLLFGRTKRHKSKTKAREALFLGLLNNLYREYFTQWYKIPAFIRLVFEPKAGRVSCIYRD
jgi:hypothetical protein